jgi:Ferric iron reductase FhuF-like transporter/FhuF 2Fe-2S C-terminal domain
VATARAYPDLLDELAALGPFFAVEAHRPGAVPVQPWRPLAGLTAPSVLRDRIGVIRSALSGRAGCAPEDVELRVAASVTQLGVVARLIAPVLAAQARGHRLGLRLADAWWQDTVGGPVPLSVVAPAAVAATDPGHPSEVAPAHVPEAATAHAPEAGITLLDEVIAPITVATGALAPVSPRVLWGNVASAVNGAAGQVARARPELAPAAWAAAAAYFRHPALGAEHDPPGPSFRRSSCCLIYRLAPGQPGAVCGDCILGGR